jgi:4-hydroxybenzoate polyprenyltransferase
MTSAETLRVSRPRFWLYLAGPYLIGLAAGSHRTEDLTGFFVWLFLIYFLFPANLLVYGVNDIFDYETDRINPKKRNYEQLVTPNKQRPLIRTILSANLPFLALVFSAVGLTGRFGILASLAGFLFFGVFYSMPPIRAKTKPLLDSFFNVLYLFPGWFGFYLAGGHGFSWRVFFSGTLWVMAMHAFSAVPDISADTRARVHTIATTLGKKGTILFCAACYFAAAVLALPHLHAVTLALGTLYVLVMIFAFTTRKEETLFKIYKLFPRLNTFSGFIIFLSALLGRLK